jgi:peptidoglycan/xylan/chitin deacetylase (PgdA/CDA1 family)
MTKKELLLTFLLIAVFVLSIILVVNSQKKYGSHLLSPQEIAQQYLVTPSAAPTPTPTPRPLTFAEMNSLYGPCVYLPTLMYHHVQDMAAAKEKNQGGLTVDTVTFKDQMQYLKDKGYQTVGFSDLINFFDNAGTIAKKSILITFDDGYDDFYLNALPILKEMDFKASVFIPTGLMDNPGYLLWLQINDSSEYGIYFGNHTWSHKNVFQAKDIVENEITLADTQLTERGYNQLKVFAYPYGSSNAYSEAVLKKLDYKLAFTTIPGSTQCLKLRYDLRRIRIGNISISAYGF